jgi:hypothetical protein
MAGARLTALAPFIFCQNSVRHSFCNAREHFASPILILLSRAEISGNSETFAGMEQMKQIEGTLRNQQWTSTLLVVGMVVLAGGIRSASAETVWDSPTVTFTQHNRADSTQPSSQDRLTPEDWITRHNTHAPCLSLSLNSWGGSVGGFSCERSTPSIVPEPSAGSMLLMGLLLAGFAQFLRWRMAASFSPRRLSRRPGTPPQDRSDRSRTSSPSCRS